MKHALKKAVERIEVFRNAWEKNAPEESFSGMTLAEFTAATRLPVQTATEILEIRREVARKQVTALNALEPVNRLLERIVFSVQGNPGYGPDSALYQELGYIRKSDRKTGLARRKALKSPDASQADSPSTDVA